MRVANKSSWSRPLLALIALLALVLLGTIAALVIAPPAHAEESAPESTSVDGWWLMPNGGTADNITWPQTATEPGNVPCGVTAQVDTYPNQAALDALAADGTLTEGEDYGVAQSWRFVYGGDCKPEQPAATTRTVQRVVQDCDARTVTTYQDTYTTEFVWSDDQGAWVPGEETGPVTTTLSIVDATNEQCPVATPTPTPTPTASVPVEQTNDTSATPQPIQALDTSQTLADTGRDAQFWMVLGILGGSLVMGGVLACLWQWFLRRRSAR
jgi:hypothetical protein